MKKSLSTTLSILLILIFAIFGMASSSSEDSSESSNEKEQVQSSGSTDGTLGDFDVQVKGARMGKTYDGKNAIVITYTYTNNNSEPQAFAYTIEDSVFQNDVGLNKAYVLTDSDNYTDDNQYKEIKKGATLDVEVAYELNDTTSDIEVELTEYLSLSDAKVTKTFSIK